MGWSAPGSQTVHADPLPSWNDGPAKTAIIEFVGKVTKEGGPDFVPVNERIATFDNDGCLWSEQPVYPQLAFAFDRIKAMASDHPEWKSQDPYRAVLENDPEALKATGKEGLIEVVMAAHAGMTTEEFNRVVAAWLATAKHPQFNRRYHELVYQPQLELLDYLRDNGFTTFIVSGGGVDFLRVFAEETYGIPPHQVVGTTLKAEYEVRDGKPVLVKQPEIALIDDKAGKPVGIHQFIGRRPILAAGNSDGDYQMLEYTTAGDGPRLGLILHHTDEAREFKYDRQSPVGKLDKALDDADEKGWIVIDMERDWNTVFPETTD